MRTATESPLPYYQEFEPPRDIMDDVREVLHPLQTPAIAFQSYETLGGDAAVRDASQADFISGHVRNPTLDYPQMDVQSLNRGIASLHEVIDVAQSCPDPMLRDTIWDSAAYRMAEMYWVQSSKRFIDTYKDKTPEDRAAAAAEVQSLNEQLYGVPDPETVAQIKQEINFQLEEKVFDDQASQLKRELELGTQVIADGQVIHVPGIGVRNPNAERLPAMPKDLSETLRRRYYEQFPEVVDAVNGYWSDIIAQRPEGEREATAEDAYKIFTMVHNRFDPEGMSGITIQWKPNASSLSWDTVSMAVQVGAKRLPVENLQVMHAKVYHEYLVHGMRALSGLRSDLPVLGTGLFTAADEGEASDYLTFEEGLASSCEFSIASKDGDWDVVSLQPTLALGLAYEGYDFRQTYETLWRTITLMKIKSGEPTKPSFVEESKKKAFQATVRVFRGTPTEMPRQTDDGRPIVLTYNKDLAYLNGKLLMIRYWEQYKEDSAMLDLLFKAKFDPMNHRQLAIVQQRF